jgi:putative Holliday junction resolvase
MRILGVDPGEKRLGLALSDPSGTIANPLAVLMHVSRLVDAAAIAEFARENQVERIIVGQALDDEGEATPQSRRAGHLAEAIRSQSGLPVELWEESGSTQAARQAQIAMGVPRSKRRGHLDDLAATFILQTYLDARVKRS